VTPVAEPEVFDLDAVYAEERGEPFTFTWEGRRWELPAFGDIDWRAAGMQAEMEAAADADGMAEVGVETLQKLFRFAFGEEQADRWEKARQPAPAMVRLFSEWQKRSGAAVGESPASTGSSPSTGRPSRRTSTASTGSGSARRSTARKRSV